jgi:integrative and conjugative element protein (TIGR02256 family)
MSERSETPAFVAYVYEKDYEEIQKLVHQYPHIETGGDLFGLWKDKKTVIIQRFIGPGKQCKRTSTSFHQDIEYLHRVGSLITTEEGLCNVGEWHSHHQIGMPEPSGADRRTVFSNMPHLGLERFVLFIASIEGKGSSGKRPHDVKLDDIKLRPFLFLGSTQKVVKGIKFSEVR